MKQKARRWIAMLLTAAISIGCVPLSALAAVEGGGTVTLLWDSDKNDYFDEQKSGSWVNLNVHECYYTQEDGSHGTSYCMDHGKAGVHQLAPSTNKFPYVLDEGSGYTQNPQAVGVIMRGSGRVSLQAFLNEFPNAPRDLTADEYRYATQVALWAALGQISVEGTSFTSGNPVRVSSEYNVAGGRVLKAAQELLKYAATIKKNYYVGAYINHGHATSDTGNLDWTPVTGGADLGAEGVEINDGAKYYTQTFKVASASFVHNEALFVGLYNPIPGTMVQIVKDANNSSAAAPQPYGSSAITVKPIAQSTTANANGSEYYAIVKLWVPKEKADDQKSYSMRLQISAECESYDIFVGYAKGHESSMSYQKYLISGLMWKKLGNSLNITWGTEAVGGMYKVVVKKTDEGGAPLAGATVQLKTASGTAKTAKTGANGEASFDGINAGETGATVVETAAPEGYALNNTVYPVSFTSAQSTYNVTIPNGAGKKLTVKKIDADTGESLAGATFKLTHISTGYTTTVTTLGDGLATFSVPNDKVGGWKCEEITAPEGYELDTSAVQTFRWENTDVTLTYQNHRRPGIQFVKRDAQDGRTLAGAVIEVSRNGQKIGDFTTGEDGTFEIKEVTKGTYAFREKQAPEGSACRKS